MDKTSKTNKEIIKQIIGLGAVAGMRSSFAPALLSHYLHKHPSVALKKSGFKYVQSAPANILTKVMALGEVIGDKLPKTPNRTDYPQVLGRIASGGFVGATIAKANKKNAIMGALMGATSALISTFSFFYLRKYTSSLPNVSNVTSGAAEDILALTIGLAVMQ
jgi:uncharacterized membrane protein